MNLQRLRLIGVALTASVCLFGLWHAEQLAAEVRFFGKKAGKPTDPAPASTESQQAPAATANASKGAVASHTDKTIKMNYFTRTWSDVLQDIAKQSGRQLIIDKVPPGRFSRNDWNRYSLADAIKIVNRELEPKGFRVLERGAYLDLVFLRDARSEYARPVVGAEGAATQPANGDSVVDDQVPSERTNSTGAASVAKKDSSQTQDRSKTATSNARRPKADALIQQAAFEEMDDEDDDEEMELPEATRRWIEVSLKRQTAQNVSRSLYQAFEHDAELIDQGPNGLPGFVVWKDLPASIREIAKSRVSQAAPKRIARFAIGVDTQDERLVIDGPQTEIAAVKALIAKLDVVSNDADRRTRLVSTKRNARQVANTLTSAVNQLAQVAAESADDAEAPAKSATPKAKPKKNTKKLSDSKAKAPTNPAAPPAKEANAKTEPDGEMEAPADKSKTSGFGGPLKADVSIEELGDVLIIRGNEQDVEIVEKLIAQIESMLAGSVPDVNVRPLKHVDSESLAELLSTVYERLNRSRGRSAQDQTQQIVVIAMGKPNAVMVLAAEKDMPTVDKLIDELDQPVDATKEFEVFRLRYAIASQILTAIESFFGGGTSTGGGGQLTAPGGSTSRSTTSGLRGRVKAIADSRTNSVIVQARPRDLEEVQRLIDELDVVGSNSVNQIKLIPLKNAVADDMANLLNLALQSVISPPQQPRTQQGGGGNQGNFGGGGAQGQVDQKLREAKSAVLQLLDTEDGEAMLESGILADIRINSDPHTNSLIVTAPEESLALIQALVKRFDKPSSMVAEIKHFSLQNADASSIVTMLNVLFNNQQQGQGQRAGGNQQNQQLGIQLAGAEDASSQLIPLKFSTDIRTNSIIAVGGAEALSVVEAIIVRLDASDARQRTMSVIRLKNSPAQEVATAVTLFLQGQQNLVGQGNQDLISDVEQLERQIVVVAEANSNSLLISATPRYLKDITEMVNRVDAAKPEVVIQALLVEVALDNTDEFGVELGFQDSILFDRSTLTQAPISVSQSSIFNTTSQTSAVNQNGQTTTTTTVTPQSLTTSTPVATGVPGFLFNNLPFGNNVSAPNPSKVGSQGLSNFSVGRTNGNLGFGGLVLSAGSDSVNVLLRALSATRRVEILSRPQIRTLDSQLGQINVGKIVPVVSGFAAAGGGTGGVGQTFTPTVIRDPSGIILEVTPRITPDDRIVMQVHAERSAYDLNSTSYVTLVNASATQGAITAPVKDISTALTTVSVANEQTIVLGGLIQKTDDQITRKVPWLGDIPILGQAFRFDSHSTRRTELLIFLTPRIIKNNSVSEIIKQIESERLHYTECEAEAIHGPLFGVPDSPNDGSIPPVYAPGEMWTPGKMTPTPPPPAPTENAPARGDATNAPRALPVPPMTDDVQGASYQRTSNANRASTMPVSRTTSGSPKKPAAKPTILDTFRRDKVSRP
ncbi:MAG: gspD [Planctomycetota bacterium]|nr:MAG: gspD [Planctomycetota bacterium]